MLILDIGYLDIGYWIFGYLDIGYFDIGYLDIGYLDIGYWILDIGYLDIWILDIWILDIWILDIVYLDIGYRILDIWMERWSNKSVLVWEESCGVLEKSWKGLWVVFGSLREDIQEGRYWIQLLSQPVAT